MPAPKVVKNHNLITNLFQKYIDNKDIRKFKGKILYYLFYRFSRLFFNRPLKIKIHSLNLYADNKRNKTSHSLIQKCDFFDVSEINVLKKLNNFYKLHLIDCGSNFGFYSFFVASLSEENEIIAIEASSNTLSEFKKNLSINDFRNIKFLNKAVSDIDNKKIQFNVSEKDWESSLVSNKFDIKEKNEVESISIDRILEGKNLENKLLVLKIDVEGADFNVLEGAKTAIKKYKPFIIIEFSKYIFNNDKFNYQYLSDFLEYQNYQIFNKDGEKHSVNEILILLKKLDKAHETIGNYYLISKNRDKLLKKIFN